MFPPGYVFAIHVGGFPPALPKIREAGGNSFILNCKLFLITIGTFLSWTFYACYKRSHTDGFRLQNGHFAFNL